MKRRYFLVCLFLIAALIFVAGTYSAPIFFYFVELFFVLPILPLFRHFAWNLFDALKNVFRQKSIFVDIFFLSIPIELWDSTAAIFRQSAGYVYCFLRLQIYEAIAAIFWQSVSYVLLSLFVSRKAIARLSLIFSDFFASQRIWLVLILCLYSLPHFTMI